MLQAVARTTYSHCVCCAGGEGGIGAGNKMHGLVGVSHASPPPSAFASAQPPRSVFADAQAPTSDSEAEADNALSPAPAPYVPVVSTQDIGRRNSQVRLVTCAILFT